MIIKAANILDATETYLCHQANCVSVNHAGLASAVFKKFPYSNIYERRRASKLRDTPGGLLIRGNGNSERFVVALLGQFFPGYPKNSMDSHEIRLNNFKACLGKLIKMRPQGSYAFPWKIGCGLAGGDWDTYINCLLAFDHYVDGEVVIYKHE